MEIAHVRAFVAVATELHFGHAADSLRIAQPHLSRRIRQLETEFGGELFERSTRSVQLTPMGEALVAPMADILRAVDAAESVAKAVAQGVVGRVKVGFAGASSHVFMAELAHRVRTAAPGIELELDGSALGAQAVAQVLERELDLAIARLDHAVPGLSSRVVGHEQLVMAVPSQSEYAKRDSISLAELADEWFVSLSVEPRAALANELILRSHEAGFTPKVAQYVHDSWLAMALVAAGVGVSLTVSSVQANVKTPGVTYLPLEDDIPELPVSVVWRTDNRNRALPLVLLEVNEMIHDA